MSSTTTKTPTVQVTVATFDAPFDPELSIFRAVMSSTLDRFTRLGGGDYQPRGGTPLRDATIEMLNYLDALRSPDTVQIGLLLDESGSMLGNEAAVITGVNEFVGGMRGVPVKEGNRVLCVIFTDGKENSSRRVTPDVLQEAISAREADGWTFIYMGANQDAWAEGSSQVGISGRATGQSVNFVSSPVGTQSAFRETSRRNASYLAGQKEYTAMASSLGNNSTVTESGDVISDSGAIQTPPRSHDAESIAAKAKSRPKKKPKPKPYGNVSDALQKASDSQT